MSSDDERAWNELADLVGIREEDRAPSLAPSLEVQREELRQTVAIGKAAELELETRARRSRMTNTGRFQL